MGFLDLFRTDGAHRAAVEEVARTFDAVFDKRPWKHDFGPSTNRTCREGWEVLGRRAGIDLTCRVANERDEGLGTPWIEVEAAIPPVSIDLVVQEQTRHTESDVARGLAIDRLVGSPAFDDRFHVEGAPADVVGRVLDADMQQRMLELRRPTLTIKPPGRLSLQAYDERDWPSVHLLLDMATRATNALRALSAEPEPEPGRRRAGLAELEAVRRRRRARARRKSVIIAILALVIGGAILLFGVR